MLTRKALCKAVTLGVDDEVDVALALERHILSAMLGNRYKAHLLKQFA